MRIILFLAVVLGFFAPLQSIAKKNSEKIYKIKLKLSDGSKIEGWLNSVLDSNLVITREYSFKSQKDSTLNDTIHYDKIKKVRFIRNGSGATGFAIGALTSITIGFLAASSVDEESEGTPAMGAIFTGVFLAIPAGITGAILARETGGRFDVNMDYENFSKLKSKFINQ